MAEIDPNKTVVISLSVPENLAQFLEEAIASGVYMFMVSYKDPAAPNIFRHSRITVNFPHNDLLPSLERHKEEFTKKVIEPATRGISTLMVDDPVVEKAEQGKGLRVLKMDTPEEQINKQLYDKMQNAPQVVTDQKVAKKGDKGGWD